MQKNNGFIWLVVILVVATLAFLFWNNKQASAPAEVPATISNSSTTPGADTNTNRKIPTPDSGQIPVTPPAQPSMTPSGAYIVYYTKNGFAPYTLTIRAGKVVHFVNSSSGAMLVETDDPNSAIYGSLNQSKSVGKNGTFDFLFSQKGSWPYHNANATSHHGLVIVQ